MILPRIFICGDSFSDDTWGSLGVRMKRFGPAITSWVEQLEQDFEIIRMARVKSSNEEILEQVQSCPVDAIKCVNLTTLSRTNRGLDPWPAERTSIKSIYKIVKTQNTYIWSPTQEYEDISFVDWIPLKDHNEMYSPQVDVVGCHFTLEGNSLLYTHIKEKLRRINE
tara:strand:- start:1574 stop:2074 length:501 start_codon:yes stop_codon:yes gene_type:complete